MADEIKAHVGDVGLVFKATVKDENEAVVDISSATTLQIKLGDPFGTMTAKTASLYSDGTDGILKYATVAGDLAYAGRWMAQGYVVTPTRTFHTSKKIFEVEGNLT
jgi:hypothetical protein